MVVGAGPSVAPGAGSAAGRPAGAPAPVGHAPPSRPAREAVAAPALAGMVGLCFLLSAGAASGSSLFVHGSHDTVAVDFDYPHWLAGPLRGLAAPLTVTGWIELVVALFALYVLVLLLADVIRPAWAVAALVA